MEASANTPIQPKPANGPGQKKSKPKKKPFQHSAEIGLQSAIAGLTSSVYTKGEAIKTIPSLSKILNDVTESIIGLNYVWEYRSPSKSVPPHYQCKICSVTRLQNDMLAHVKGWKHGFKYIKKVHPTKVDAEEEAAIKDPVVRKQIKEVAAQVEAEEGRGQLKVILKEPCDVIAFKGMRTAVPRMVPSAGPGMGPRMGPGMGPRMGPGMGPRMGPRMGPKGPQQGGRFQHPIFPAEYPSREDSFHDFPMDMFEEQGIGSWSRQDLPRPDVGPRRFPEDMGHPHRGDDFGPHNERGDYGMGGLIGNSPGRGYSDEFMGSHMEGSKRAVDVDRPVDNSGLMGDNPDNNSLPATLLNYLDTFRIENENDAQVVLKVTQKLTDVLMEFRLRSVNAGVNSSPVSSMGYSSSSRMPNSGDRYSDNFTGPSRYSDRPSRFYN